MQKRLAIGLVAMVVLTVLLWQSGGFATMESRDGTQKEIWAKPVHAAEAGTLETATFAGGCFWCTEAVFRQLKGVDSVVSGYAGGHVPSPSYEDVVSGATGHAEAIQIKFDPHLISYPELLEVFWNTHDPTTMNRQGNDVGTQYRSVIFAHTPEQKRQAEYYKNRLDEAEAFARPIVTKVEDFTEFHPAEDYHQDYYRLNANEGYCQYIIAPKLDKLRKVFKEKLR